MERVNFGSNKIVFVIDFVVTVSSRAVRISRRAVRVFPALSLRRVRPSYGTFSLMVFQGKCARGRKGHMIKQLIIFIQQKYLFNFNKNNFIQQKYLINFNKNNFIQQKYLFNFNKNNFIQQNFYSTSTNNNFIQQQYLFNFNPNYFHSTKIFIQLQPKIISFNNKVPGHSKYRHSTKFPVPPRLNTKQH